MTVLQPVPASVNETADIVIDAAGRVRRKLGVGLHERFYQRGMEIELTRREVPYLSKPAVPVAYDGEWLGNIFPDLIVGGRLVAEAKAVEATHPVHEAQLLTYLTATGLPPGLLINFHALPFGTAVTRRVNRDHRWGEPGGPGEPGSGE